MNIKNIDLALNAFEPYFSFWTGHTQTLLGHLIKSDSFKFSTNSTKVVLPDEDHLDIEYVKGDLKLEANCKLNYLEGDILSIETYVDIINYSFKNKSIKLKIFLPLYKIEINDNTSLNYSEVLDNLKSEIKKQILFFLITLVKYFKANSMFVPFCSGSILINSRMILKM